MDTINALFEMLGTVMMLPSIVRSWRLRRVEGVHIATPLFFWLWGAWNIIYYPSLGQWWSFSAGLVLFVTNTVWIYTVWRLTPRTQAEGRADV